jgi:inner membrane protein
LLISEDNALILGSLMLFFLLAAVMVLTRKVDWYRGASEKLQESHNFNVPPPPPLVS